MQRWSWMSLSLLLGLGVPATAGATDINAGPIWNQADAQNKCPTVCKAPLHWNGNWKTTVPNKMSVCGCDQPPPPPPPSPGKHAVNAGPIWNQADAQAKCASVCKAPEKWDGQWWTTVPNKMSVCECTEAAAPPPQPAHDVDAGPIWNQADAQNKCPKVCKLPEKWNGQWRTTVPNKMSVCGCAG